MVRNRLAASRDRLRAELERALEEDHEPREIAASFSFGTFVTALPTLGTGLLLFVAVSYLSDRVSTIALFASVLVLNPVVKWGVYAASFWLGVQLLGPVPDANLSTISFSAGPEIAIRLLVGNVVLAVVFAVVGYVVVLRIVHECRRRNVDPVELPAEVLSD